MAAPIRVLHVDDEPDFAALSAEFLQRADDRLEVVTESTAADGLDRLAADRIDCVVSDYDMPGMDGQAFLEAVREEYPDLPFILFTGKGSEEVASEAISAGVTDYLQKEPGRDQYAVLANRITNAVERRRLERDAERTRTQLQAVAENSTDAIVTLDADGHVRFTNPAVEDLFGYSPDDLADAPLTRIVPDADAVLAPGRRPTGDPSPGDSTVDVAGRHREGHEIPLSVSVGAFEQDGRRRLVAIIRDVSERERMEAELREREERFHQLARNVQDVVWMSDPEKEEMLYVNPVYEEVWGRSVEGLYEDPSSFLDAIHPGDRPRVEAALDEQATGGYDEEYRIVRPDGEIRWIHDRAVPVRDDDGEVYRIVGIASDVTEREEHRRRLETLVDNLPGIVYRCHDDPEWSMEHVGGECESLTGYDAAALETGDVTWGADVVHPDDRARVRDAVRDALATDDAFEVTYRIVTREGSVKRVWERGREVDSADGDAVVLEGFITDIAGHREETAPSRVA